MGDTGSPARRGGTAAFPRDPRDSTTCRLAHSPKHDVDRVIEDTRGQSSPPSIEQRGWQRKTEFIEKLSKHHSISVSIPL